ncbi:MAG: TetR/AcrR family transcriptional regulator [Acidimicrobiales bacterium]
MTALRTTTREPLASIQRTAAQTRIITAALDLFLEHGVSGTSLQMIANAVGVTKAAVYHQFPTKDEIVLAVAEHGLLPLEAALDAAEAEGSRAMSLDILLTEMVDLAVANRRMVSSLQHDPVVVRLLAEHEPFRRLMARQNRLLVGTDTGPDARVSAAMVSGAIVGAVTHPLVVDLDDDTLRSQLLDLARRFLTPHD